jgi:hypothetical protein
MYDPFFPNDFAVLIQARSENRPKEVPADSTVQLLTPMPLLTPEAAHRERVRISAAMGVASALQLQRDDDDLLHKQHVQQGLDVKSRVGRMLGLPGGTAEAAASDSIGGGVANLEFVPSGMSAGGHVLAATERKPVKPVLKGKPSSTVLLRNIATRGAVDSQLQADLLSECSRYGVVRGLVVYAMPDGHPLSLNEVEGLRVFVRYDTVAAAFKAAESLNGRSFDGRKVAASFYPTVLFDNSQLAEEQPLAV